MNKSAAKVAISARRISACGIAWPNEIVAVLTMPRQRTQEGAVPSRSKAMRMSASSCAGPAIEAGGVGGVAVQLDDFLRGDSGGLVQPVDILGDDRADLAAPHQRVDRAVAAIGLGAPEVSSIAKRRRQVSRRAASEARKSSKYIGAIWVQMPPGLRKSGNPQFGADPGAGEDDRAARFVDQAGKGGNPVIGVHGGRHHGTLAKSAHPAKLVRPRSGCLEGRTT